MLNKGTKKVFSSVDPSSIFNKFDADYKEPEKFDDIVLRQLNNVIDHVNNTNSAAGLEDDIAQLNRLLAQTILNSHELRVLALNTRAKVNLKIFERIEAGLKIYIEHLHRKSVIFNCISEVENYPDSDSDELYKFLSNSFDNEDKMLAQGDLHVMQKWFSEHGEELFTQLKKLRSATKKHFSTIDIDSKSNNFPLNKSKTAKLKELLVHYVYENPNINWGKTFVKANELTPDIGNQIDQKAQALIEKTLECIFPKTPVSVILDDVLHELANVKKIITDKIAEEASEIKSNAEVKQSVTNTQLEHNTIVSLYQQINAIENVEVKRKLLSVIEPFYLDPSVENIFLNLRDKSFTEIGSSDAMMRIDLTKIQTYLSRLKPLSEAQLILKENVLNWLANLLANKDKYTHNELVLAKQLTVHLVQTLYRAQEKQNDDEIVTDIRGMQERLQASSHDDLKKSCALFIKRMECHGLLSLTKDHSKRNFNPSSVNNYEITDDKHLQLYALETSKLQENVSADRQSVVFKNLLFGYKNLIIAAQLGNVDAKAILGKRILSTDLNATVNNLYLEKLKTYSKESKLYQEAQFKLALCYYNKRYQQIYTSYEDRLRELYLMLEALQQAGDISHELCQALQINEVEGLVKEDLQLNAYKLLVLELAGLDPLAPLFPNHSTIYPFQYSETKLQEILESGFSKREDKDKFISDFVRNQKNRFVLRFLPCVKENDGYTLSINADKFDHVRETKSFVDPVSHEEVARLINEKGVIHFVGFKNHLDLKIEGALTRDNYIFDNVDGDLKLAGNFNAQNNLNIISHTKALDFKGDIQSKASINFENAGDLNLTKESTVSCDKSLNLTSSALQLSGKIKSELAQITLDQSLLTSAESEIKANNILLTANAFKDLRGAINADEILQIRSADAINLNGSASLSAKKQLYIKAKEILATDQSSVKSNNDMVVMADDSITIDKESAWNAEEITLYSKVIKNNSSHLQFDKASINASNFTNSEQGEINTKEYLKFTGDDVANYGRLNFGEHLYVNINKLFSNGYSKDQSLLDAFKNCKAKQTKGVIEGKDVSIVAANYINMGKFEIRNLDVTAETALNAGLESTADNKKTALIIDNEGSEIPNWKECDPAIEKFRYFVQCYGTNEILENLDAGEPETYAAKLAKKLLPTSQKTSTSDFENGQVISGSIKNNSLFRYTDNNSETAVKIIKRFKESKEEQALTKANIELVSGEKLDHSGADYAKYNYSQVDERIERGKIYADLLVWHGTSLQTDEKSILNAKQMIINEINATFYGKSIGNSMDVTAEQLHLAATSKTEMKELLQMEAKNITLDGSITTDKLFSHSKELTKANGPIKAKESKMFSDKKIIYNNQFSRTEAKKDGDKPSFTANAKEEVEYTKKSHVNWKGTTLTQAENIKEAGTKEVTHDINHASKEHETAGETHADMVSNTAEKAILKGKYIVKDAFVLDATELQMKQSSKVDAEGHVLFEIVNGVIEGEHNIKSLKLTAKERLLNRSHLKLHRGTIKASDYINENKIELADNEVELQVVFDGKTKQSQAQITKKSDAELTTSAKELAIPDSEFLGKVDTKALGIDAELFVKMNFQGDSKALNIYLKTKALKEQPHSSDTHLNIDADTVEQTNKGSMVGEGSIDINAKQSASLDGLFNVKQIIVDGGKVILKATIKGDFLSAQAKQELVTKGTIAVDTAFLKSDKEIDLNGQLKVENGVVDAPVINDEADTQFSKDFILKADRLKMSHQSKTRGYGTLKIDAHLAEMRNVDAKEVDVTLDHIANPNDFLLQRNTFSTVHGRESMKLQTKDKVSLDECVFFPYSVAIIAPTIDIVANIGGTQELRFKTTEGDLRTFKNVSAGKVLVLDAHNNFFNNLATINGGEALFVHSGGNIINRAGTLVSPIYVQLVSDHGDIINEAIQHTVPGAYGPMQHYVPGYIYGGIGAGHEGYGLFAQGRKFINDASVIHSLGSNYLYVDKDLDSIARYNQYLSYHKEWHNAWRDKETNEYKYQLQPAVINSVYGKNVLVSENGGINFLSTQMFGKEGNDLSAKGPINLLGLVLETKCEKDATAGLGLLRDHSKELHEINVPTVVLDYDHTNIVSLSDINILNASLIGGDLALIGENVYVSAPILNHSYEQESWGFDFALPNLSQLPGYSMVVDAKAFKEGNAVEKLASAWNMGVDSVNTLNSLAVAAAGNNPFLGLCAPSAEASFGRTHEKSNYQKLAENVGISRSASMYIKADNTIGFLNGVPVIVAGDASLNAKRFLQKSAELKSSSENDSEAVTAGIGLDAKPRFGVKASYSRSQQTNHVNQLTQVGGRLETNFNEWEMNGANVIAGNWSGNVAKLRIITPLNTGNSMSASAEANTAGVISANYSENDYAVIGTPSGILVLNNINGANDKKIHVGETYLKGGKILAEGENNYETDSLVAEDVNEHRDGHSFGFTACIENNKENEENKKEDGVNKKETAGNKKENAGNKKEKTRNKQESGQAIPYVPVQLGYEYFRAKQRSTIFGKKGTNPVIKKKTGDLNTENADGHKVESNAHFSVTLKIPTSSICKGLETTRENLKRVQERIKERRMGPQKPEPAAASAPETAPTTAPADKNTVASKQQENKPEDPASKAPAKKSAAERLRERSAAKKQAEQESKNNTSAGSTKKQGTNTKTIQNRLNGTTNIKTDQPITDLDTVLAEMNDPDYFKLKLPGAHENSLNSEQTSYALSDSLKDKSIRLGEAAWRGLKSTMVGIYNDARYAYDPAYQVNKNLGMLVSIGSLIHEGMSHPFQNPFTFNKLERSVEATAPVLAWLLISKGIPKLGFFGRKGVAKAEFQLNRFHQAARNLSEEAQQNIRTLRGWAKSKGWVQEKNPLGKPERWGTYENGIFNWRLRIKPEGSLREGLAPGSNIPRFDARLGPGGNKYINPFMGKVGGEEIGTHVSLENPTQALQNNLIKQSEKEISVRRPSW